MNSVDNIEALIQMIVFQAGAWPISTQKIPQFQLPAELEQGLQAVSLDMDCISLFNNPYQKWQIVSAVCKTGNHNNMDYDSRQFTFQLYQ